MSDSSMEEAVSTSASSSSSIKSLNELEDIFCETLGVLEEPATKEVILCMLSTTTDLPVANITDDVDSVIEKLTSSGRLTKHNGKYALVPEN